MTVNRTLNFPFLLNATQLTSNCKGMRQQYTLDDIKRNWSCMFHFYYGSKKLQQHLFWRLHM